MADKENTAKERSLDWLAEEMEILEVASGQIDSEMSSVRLRGNIYFREIYLPEVGLWDSEEDEREWNKEGTDYIETVQEHVFHKIEDYANKLLKIVERARVLIKEEENND